MSPVAAVDQRVMLSECPARKLITVLLKTFSKPYSRPTMMPLGMLWQPFIGEGLKKYWRAPST